MDREKIIVKTSIKGIIVNVVLVIFKALIGFITNSIMIVLDAVNNLSDAMSSIITIIGIKLAKRKPDKKHPYGHGRIEYLTSMIIGVIVLIAGLTSLKESIEKIIEPVEASYSVVSLIIIAVAVVVKFIFGMYVKKVGKKINSQSLVASGTDAFFDSILSFSTLIAAIISIIWHLNVEGILGILISVIIIKSSIEILKETADNMIGIRVDGDVAKKIKETINSFEEVQGTYDLMLHNYGPDEMMGSAHIQVDDEMTAKQIHILTRSIEARVYAEHGIILTLGIYASNTSDEKYAKIKEELNNIIKKYNTILQLHGFYVDEKTNNVVFDLIIDFSEKKKDEIKDKVIAEIKEKYPEYNYYVIIDNDYSD